MSYVAASQFAYDSEICLTVIGDFDWIDNEVVESVVFRFFDELAH